MTSSKLIQLLIPIENSTRNAGLHEKTKKELIRQFNGVTRYNRAPAEGLWKNSQSVVEKDHHIVYEVMAPKLKKKWWRHYSARLAKRFGQKSISIRAQKIEII